MSLEEFHLSHGIRFGFELSVNNLGLLPMFPSKAINFFSMFLCESLLRAGFEFLVGTSELDGLECSGFENSKNPN